MSQENSGIGANVISLPKGGGSVSGMGETFSPDLFSGTGNFSVPIAVPAGRNGLQPELTLGYSSGNGNGFFGLGWAMSIPGVSRKTSLGVPQYDDDKDIFVLSGAEDLIPTDRTETFSEGVNYRKTWYKPRTEGLFAQIIHHKYSNGANYWEVKSKDGMVSYYGNPDPESEQYAQMRDPENASKIAQWFLFKTVDVFGNEIRYDYLYHLVPDERAPYVQVYPHRIRYADYLINDETNYLCSVQFKYEDRPDPNSSFRSGFEVRSTLRCSAVKTFTHPQNADLPEGYSPDPEGNNIAVKTYHLTYRDEQGELPSNGTSILVSVQPEGHSATEDEQMPPLSFGYTEFVNDLRNFKEIKGKHLPVVNLNHPELTFADLNGDGLPDLVQASPGQPIRYWTNKGNGEFALPRSMTFSPQGLSLGDEGVQLMDADGDGRIDLVVNRPQTAGYFPLNHDGQWDRRHFIKYKQSPNFSLKTANVRMMDLTGDGRTDVLINGNRFECYFQNSPLMSDGPGEGLIREDYVAGWSGMRQVNKKSIEAFPNVNFDDPRIHTADMSGDGLQDIVEISNGRIAWWPNLGYGRFGSRRIMKKAPRFGQNFDPQRILLGDLNGDGLTDLVYLDNNKITYWVNLHGNAWGEANEIKGTPRFALGDSVQIVDLMGSGTPGILWSFERTGTQTRMYYLDLCRGVKPYVLNEMNNNMGAITRVEYTSSIRHYLRDLYGTSVTEDPGTNLPDALDLFVGSAGKWKTTLPFPTQVVNRVEVIDEISEGKLTTHYFYHHGYWDGGEREFRGFGRVDQFDSEDFNHFNETSLHLDADFEGVSQEHYSPPMLVKNWFHLGPVGAATGEWEQLFFENEYHSSDPQVLPPSSETLQLLAGLPRRARRDAYRTLRGTALRTESYAVDGSNRQFKPYTVSETRPGLQLKDHPGNNPVIKMLATQRHSNHIFFSFTDGSRTTQWERGDDPMVKFNFSGDFDDYGQPRRTLNAALPRGISSPYTDTTSSIAAEDGGGNILATLSLTDYAQKDDETHYIVDRVCRNLSYEVDTNGVNVFQLRDDLMSAEESDIISNNVPMTLTNIGCQLNYYDGNAFIGKPYGQMDGYGAVVRSETLILTSAILDDVHGSGNHPEFFKTSPDLTGYPQGFQDNLQNDDSHLGYSKLDETYAPTGWYAPGAKTQYDFQDGGNTDPRGLVEETHDAFDNRSTVAYDDYKLMPVSSRQHLDATNYLETTADYDYRILQPWMVTDPNGNRSVFGFSPLGLLMKSGVIGKENGDEGDIITETPFDWKPSVQMEYDFLAWYEEQKPVWVKTIQNEQHYQDDQSSPTIAKVEFSDGFGRLLQTRAQAEDVIFGATADDRIFGDSGLPVDQSDPNANALGTERGSTDPLNVVVSGWQVYDNKGRVVEQFEPFFSQGLDDYTPVQESQMGEYLTIYYDPAGRVVRTVNPDGSEQRLIVGIPSLLDNPDNFDPSPWHHYAYDANDLSDITNIANDNVADSHKYTPKSEIVDALGRTIKTTEHKAASDNGQDPVFEDVVMMYQYDIRGNLKKVTDALDRVAFEYEYDLANQPLKTTHIDSGVSRATIDAAGKPIEGSDAKDAETLAAYDRLSRPIYGWAKNDSFDTLRLTAYNRYGEEATNPEDDNLRGQLWEQYDEAGKVEIGSYDFKGNVLSKIRKVLDGTTLKNQLDNFAPYLVDWTGLPSILDSMAFETSSEYDALNRVTKLTLPENVNQVRQEILPEYNRAGALEKVTYDGGVYVENIVYSAKGQRLLIAFGNDIMTRYTYDSKTFRLLRQRSEKYVKSQDGSTITYSYQNGNNKQDDGFEYDLVGNIIKILHRVNDCGIDGSGLGINALDRVFEYDPLNRLLSATGRESDTQNQNDYLYAEVPAPGTPNANNVQAYTRKYQYDKMGNVLQVKQQGSNGFTRKFGYFTDVNTLEKISDVNDVLIEDFTYDSTGSQLTAGTNRHYIWTAANRLLVYKNQAGGSDPTIFAQYDYDGAGNRVSKLVRTGNGNATYTRTIYIDGIFEYHKLENGSTYEKNYVHVMDDQSRIAMVRVGDQFPDDISEPITYLIENQTKSSAVRLDTNGTVIDREEFYPFGDSSLRTFSKKRYRYVGKEKDLESGLYHYGARYYSAWTCRFISVDALAKKYNQLTPYQNAGNNPINDRDIDGNKGGKTEKGGDNSGNVTSQTLEKKGKSNAQLSTLELTGSEEIELQQLSSEGGNNDDWWQSKDEEGNYTGEAAEPFELPEVTITAKAPTTARDNTRTSIQVPLELEDHLAESQEGFDIPDEYADLTPKEIIDFLDEGILFLSIAAQSIEHLGGLEKAQKLIEEGKFQMLYNGERKTWSLKFKGNATVSSEIVAAGKSDFSALAAKNSKILGIVRAGGIVLGLGGFGLSVYQYSQGEMSGYELGADAVFTGIGIAGGPFGAAISITYFGLKTIYDHIPEDFEDKYPYPSKYYRYGE